MKLTKLYPVAMLTTMLAIALGIAGKVDWWVVVLIILSYIRVGITL